MFRHSIIPVLLVATFVSPAPGVDTLQVSSPDPILEGWRWTEFDRSSGLAGRVRSIFEDRDGNVWFATDRGAQRYDGIHWTTYTTGDGLAQNDVRAVIQTRDGAMWFGTGGGGISRFDGEAWTMVEVPVGAPRSRISRIHQASDGALWFTTWSRGVLRFDGTGWTRYTVEDGLAGNGVRDILESRDGSLWVGFGGVEGISRFDGKGWRTYTARDGLPEGVRFNNLWQTKDGTVWAGSSFFGGGGVLCRFDGERWKPYASEEIPQVSGSVWGFPMRDGAFWIREFGADKAFRFDYTSTKWMTFTHEEGLFGGYSPPDGSVWFATRSGALRREELAAVYLERWAAGCTDLWNETDGRRLPLVLCL